MMAEWVRRADGDRFATGSRGLLEDWSAGNGLVMGCMPDVDCRLRCSFIPVSRRIVSCSIGVTILLFMVGRVVGCEIRDQRHDLMEYL